MMKRIMSLALAFIMLMSVFPATVFASDEPEVIVTPGSDETAVPTGETEPAPCLTCGALDCGSLHENWCDKCKMDNCGKNHCPNCGEVDCAVDHSAQIDEGAQAPECKCTPVDGVHAATCPAYTCPDCGGYGWHETCPETGDETPACEICGNDPCTCEDAACEICGNDPCTCEDAACEVCGNDPCTCEEDDGEEPDYSANLRKYVILNKNVTYYTVGSTPGTGFSYYYEDFTSDAIFRIKNWEVVDGTVWYLVEFYKGAIVESSFTADFPSAPWICATTDGADAIVFLTACGVCDKPDCETDHTQPENPCGCCDECTGDEECACECEECEFCESEEEPEYPVLTDDATGVKVTLENLPEGVSLSVSEADVSAQLNKFGVPAAKKVFGLDISLSDAENGDYQPEGALVKIPVSAAPGKKIGIIHTHKGVTTYMGLTAVLSDGTVEFYTDGFSEFAGFTVDFHYNGVDFSIDGRTSILLSVLFAEMGINENAYAAETVVFSDTSLVLPTRQDNGDWLLSSLEAFSTEETLIISFADGHTIVIDVTDAASLTNAKELSGDTILFFADVADQYGINATITDTYGWREGRWYLQIDGVQKSESKATMTYGGNHFGIRSDYYWFEVSGSGNWSYKSGDLASFKFDGLPGTVSITYNAHSNVVYNNTSYCQVRQQSQAVYTGHTDTRCVKIYADGNFVQEIWPVMPSRDKNRGYSASDIYVDALYGPYYTSSVSLDGNSYRVDLYSRYTVSASVADSKGTASPASQTVNYGKSGTITFTASTGNLIDYIMDGSTKVDVTDADSYTYTVSNVTSARNVVAYTKIKTFTVSYSSNGGSGTTAAQTFNYGGSVALRANGFTASSGYQFLGWYSSADKAVYTAGATYARNESTTMTALWGKTDSNGSWNSNFYVLPGTSAFSEHLKVIDGATKANTSTTIARPNIVADSNTYYVAPNTTLTFERSGGQWRIDAAETGITTSVGTSWTSSGSVTVNIGGSTAAGTTMMLYSRNPDSTTVNCARIIVASKAEVTVKAINDTQNIYRVGVYILNDSTKIPGEPNYTSGVSMINVNGGMNYSPTAKGVVLESIANAGHYDYSLDGSCTMGVVDYTGHETIPYMNEALLNDAMDRVIQALDAGTVLTAADGANLTELYKEKGEAYIRTNYVVRPHVVKLMTGLSYTELGWHIDCSIYPLKTVTLTYNLNAPAGYVLKNQGTPAPGIFTGDLEAQAATFTVSTSLEMNAVVTASVSGAADTASLTFNGWNTEPNGTGTTYAPGSTITLTGDETLYAQWIGGDFNTGTLEIYKKVNVADYSEQPNANDAFTFSVNLSGNRAYSIYDADTGALISSGTMTNGTFSLKDGQFIRFEMVPVAANAYTVTETNTPVNYSATAATQSVTLKGGYINQITFTNTYNKPLTFGVTYEYTGNVPAGAAAVPAAQNHTYNTSVSVADEPAAVAAYTSSGWTTSDATVSNGSFTMPGKAVKFTGNWTAIDYTATFVYGGSHPDSTDAFTINEGVDLPVLNRTGYTYVWKVTEAAGNWAVGDTYTGASVPAGKYGDVTFTLVWTPNTDAWYKVHYYYEGTTNKLAPSVKVETRTYNEEYTVVAPSITGHDLVSASEQTVIAGYENNEVIFYYKPIKYTITWRNDDNSVIDTTTVEYGLVPTHADPVKAATTEYTYTFAGWTPEVVAVTGDASYKATFDAVKNKYTVTFVDDDGEVLKEATEYEYGTAAANIVKPANPEKAATAEYTYTFAGWSPDITDVTGDATYTATYTATKNKYSVEFVDENGTVLKEATEYEYGTAAADIEKPADPVKKATAEYTYTFAGWTPEIADVSGNATYTAIYTAVKNKYTITWLNDDNSVIDTTTVEYGLVPTHAAPAKAATAQYTYTFAGWTPDVVAVTGDASYKATFDAEVNKYTVIWKNEDGSVLETDEDVEFGIMPTYDGDAPEKAEHNQYTYTFAGWSPDVVTVSGNVTYTARFDPHENFYTVTWENYDGTVLETDENVAWDTAPEYNGGVPKKEGNAQYSYTFDGWTTTPAPVRGNVTYTAKFKESINHYTVIWKNEDGEVLETDENVMYGATPSYDRAAPEKPATAEYTYTFKGWTPAVVTVTGDATYTATFDAVKNKYTVTFVDDDEKVLLAAKEYEYGTPAADIEKPADPVKKATAQYTYTFDGWDPEIDTVTENVVYKAKYSFEINEYTVTTKGEHGTGGVVTVEYGQDASTWFETDSGYRITGYQVDNGNVVTVPGDRMVGYNQIFPSVKKDKLVVYFTAPIEYKIVYDNLYSESGEATELTDTYNIEKDLQLLGEPKREGYNFVKWELSTVPYNSNWVSGDYEAGQQIGIGKYGDITMYAVWDAIDYSITYNLDGGALPEGESNPESYTVEDRFTLVEPTKVGHTFLGWTGTGLNDATKDVTVAKGSTGNRSYTAMWKAIVYDVEWYGYNNIYLTTTHVAYGDMPVQPTGVDLEDRISAEFTEKFIGWDPELVPVTGNTSYVAKYDKTRNWYYISFEDDDGTVLKDPVLYEYGTPAEKIERPEDPVKPATEQHTYVFAGWDPTVDDVKGTVTYKATYTSYATLNGEIENGTHTGPVTVESWKSATISFTADTGYKIIGHQVNDGEPSYADNYANTWSYTHPALPRNYTVKVFTEAVEYNISYKLDGGALPEGVTNPEKYTIETESFTLNNPTKAGYEFLGWAETANAESGSKTVIIEKGSTGDKTYFALWKRSLVDLTIVTNSTDANQSFIFTVSGTRSDEVEFKSIEVVLVGNDSITIKDMPVGDYTVTEKNNWSWRQNNGGSQTADLTKESKTVTFSFGVDRPYWLSGCSYYGRRKGGNG